MSSSSYKIVGYHFCILFTIFSFSSIGCAASIAAPVITIKPFAPVMKGEHFVEHGETLYSIAWRYNRDFRDIAKINNIVEPYYLKIGQRLTLNNVDLAKAHKAQSNNETWHWPTTGKIIKAYSNELNKAFNKGIDIAGQLGSPIMAAMPGKVVYSGNGLRGLGQLLIIKHADHFLSAYAHNQELMVKEGQHVKQGQIVAKMGSTGSNTTKLHFEIRYKGQAVNPLNLLPKQTALAFH